VARTNAERLSLTVTFLEGDLDQPLVPLGHFDLIVANLPYVPSAQIDGLAADVRSEPRLALDGGADGLALLRRLVAGRRTVAAGRLLGPGGRRGPGRRRRGTPGRDGVFRRSLPSRSGRNRTGCLRRERNFIVNIRLALLGLVWLAGCFSATQRREDDLMRDARMFNDDLRWARWDSMGRPCRPRTSGYSWNAWIWWATI